MRYTNCSVLNSSNGTLNATGPAIDATAFKSFSVLSVSTGTLAGTLTVQGSNDPAAHPGNPPTNWSTIGTPISVTAASVLNTIIPDSPFMWVRAVFSGPSGTGGVSARLKSVGW